MKARLDGRVALVTGASRRVGRGIAIGLGEAGAEAWVTARTLSTDPLAAGSPEDAHAPASLEEAAREVEAAGGRAVAAACDLVDDAQVERLFARLAAERPRLDVLVNSAWGGYEGMVEAGEFTWSKPFWEQSMRRWDAMFDAGLRATFACSRLAARRMVEQGSGLIVNVSFWAARKYIGNAIYGSAKCATDRLTADMGRELEGTGVTAVARTRSRRSSSVAPWRTSRPIHGSATATAPSWSPRRSLASTASPTSRSATGTAHTRDRLSGVLAPSDLARRLRVRTCCERPSAPQRHGQAGATANGRLGG